MASWWKMLLMRIGLAVADVAKEKLSPSDTGKTASKSR